MEEFFYKNLEGITTEGYLDKEKVKDKPLVLFILREPDARYQNSFWFKEIYDTVKNTSAESTNKYYTKLGVISPCQGRQAK